ncbi:hypothetical protein QE152_g38129 [Popillia japonica]|uniref:Uncharacterized protein n=1 Tax=Popillia japonica TaxID=7064 RepID=A0AAW1I7Y1_POPJA
MKFRKDLSFRSDSLNITFLNTPLNDEEEVNFRTGNKIVASENIRLDDIFASLPLKDLEHHLFCDTHQKETDPIRVNSRSQPARKILVGWEK